MAIILKGWESVQEVDSLSSVIKKPETKRVIGYLLFELSALETWKEVSERIQEIKNKRAAIEDVPGMKKEPPPVEIQDLENLLNQLRKQVKEKYAEVTSVGRQRVPQWEYDSQEAPYLFFRHLLKKYAGKLISESGAAL
jgi:hypothetical protein